MWAEGERSLWVGPHQQGTGLRGGEKASEGTLPAVFVGVSAPPWEAGILVLRTTSDAWGQEAQVLLGTKPCK